MFGRKQVLTQLRLFSSVSKYKRLTNDDVDYFKTHLGEEGVCQDADAISQYNTDWMKWYKGKSPIVLFPESANSLSKVLAYCNEQKIPVVPQGGNTGLVGGSIPVFDEVIISTKRMDNIIHFNPISGIVTCQAGVILQNLNDFAKSKKHIIPVDLGAKGSCTIGGNVATNAGGIRFLRYGSLHGSVTGLEIVLPNGEVINTLGAPRKDNTGIDVKQLFIGSEGSLGIITAVSIHCAPLPTAIHTVLLGCSTYEKTLEIFAKAREYLGEILSAFEFIDSDSYHLSIAHNDLSFDPLRSDHPFYVLVETSGSNHDHDYQKIEDFIENVISSEITDDGIISQSEMDVDNMWTLRESLGSALVRQGYVYKYDLSLPYDKFYKIVEDLRKKLPPSSASVYGYGHLGDANLHLNIVSPKYSQEVKDIIEPWVYEYCRDNFGSVSAEHGLGQLKKDYVEFCKTPAHLSTLYNLKKLFDPNEILNPYKILPSLEKE